MAKDPAFLFYPGDWLGGTIGMSFEEKGAYLELLIFQFNRGKFTEKQALSCLRDKELWETLKVKFTYDEGLYCNKKLEQEQTKRKNFTESRRQSRLKSDEDNVRIYIVMDVARSIYKIGSSVNPKRRYNELSNQINPAIMFDDVNNRNIILVWYSNPIIRAEEKKLHNHFAAKKIKGEWFSLTNEDILYITSTYNGTYDLSYEKTYVKSYDLTTGKLTENENENVNILKLGVKVGGVGEGQGEETFKKKQKVK